MSAKTKPKVETVEEVDSKEKKIVTSKAVLGSFLKQNVADHYNFEETVDYKVSSGSFQLDLYLGGGLGPGLHRFCGINEGGKTSAALSFMNHFLKKIPNAKGVYIKAEGRLSKEMKERSGVKFVFSEEEWEDGTCFVFESNIYETVVDAMRQLITRNDEKKLYYFILDSVDGLISKGDLDKGFEDSNKVAGGAVIAANFMKRLSIALSKRGHMAVFISQVRADIKLDPYTKTVVRQTSATGGNALLHFANWIIEFEPKFRGDLILKDPENKTIDPITNPILGHIAKATIKKSPNERTNFTIPYPIRYGRTNGNSVWIEKELVDLLFVWELLIRKGSWISAVDEFNEMLVEGGFESFPKIQGMDNVFAYIEKQPELIKFLTAFFKKEINEE